jgi:hypothetical protein
MKKVREQFDQLTLKSKAHTESSEPQWKSQVRAEQERQRESWQVISKLAKEAGR